MENEKTKKVSSTTTKKVVRKTRKPKETQFTVPRRDSIEKFLKERIFGQDKFIRRVLIAIYRRVMFGITTNILVVGDSGSGKTETLKLIAETMQIPYTIENATEYTQMGYVGNDIENIVENIYFNAKELGIKDRLPLGIVIMDEIDKKAEDESLGRGESISGKAVQQSLLKFMDGMTIPVYDDEEINKNGNGDVKNEDISFKPAIELNTRNLIFVCIGAFEGLSEIRDERLHKNRIGFKKTEGTGKESETYTDADFIKYGMIKEFMGRFDCIAETNKLKLEDIEKIITHSKISAFKLYENLLEKSGVKISYSQKMIENMAKKAFSLNIGARGIKNITNYIFENIMCEVMDSEARVPMKCVLEDAIVDDNTKYYFVPA